MGNKQAITPVMPVLFWDFSGGRFVLLLLITGQEGKRKRTNYYQCGDGGWLR